MTQLKIKWDGVVIAMSLFVSFIGSFACITLYEQYRMCSRHDQYKLASPRFLLALMSISLGGIAIWSMHLIGMSAVVFYKPDGEIVSVHYRVDFTFISLAVVLVCTFLGIFVSTRDGSFLDDSKDVVDRFVQDLKRKTIEEMRAIPHKRKVLAMSLFRDFLPLVAGGFLVATGVCLMHYIGMMALEFDGYLEWDIAIVTSSCLIALLAATAALWIMLRLLATFPNIELLRIASAIVMSIAVNGMHYTGMAAATFNYDESHTRNEHIHASAVLFQEVADIVVFLFVAIIFIVSITDLRAWYNNINAIHSALENYLEMVIKDDSRPRRETFFAAYKKMRDGNGSDEMLAEFSKAVQAAYGESSSIGRQKSAKFGSRLLSSKVFPQSHQSDILECEAIVKG